MELPDDNVPLGLNIKRRNCDQRYVDKTTGTRSIRAKQYRKHHKVKISTISVVDKRAKYPAPVEEFVKLTAKPYNFSWVLLENLRKLEYNVPTPVQAQSIPLMHKRYNLVACAPTGSGKTAAYLLPLLNEYINQTDSVSEWLDAEQSGSNQSSQHLHKIQLFGLILAPTQELVRQIWSEAVRLSLGLSNKHFIACLKRKHYANRGKSNRSGVKVNENRTDASKNLQQSYLQHRARELRLPRSTRILVATPCRMGVLLSLDPSQCPFDLSRLSWLIIDECDKMLQVDLSLQPANANRKLKKPRDFRDQMAPIFQALSQRVHESWSTNPKSTCVALFSATIPEEVSLWVREELSTLIHPSNAGGGICGKLVELRVSKRDSAVSTVSQELRYCATEEGKLLEMRCLLVRGLMYPCLIFMESRERAKELVQEILFFDTDVLANVISSDKTEAQRAAVVRAFREGQLNVLVCTDLLGRGIDFKGVSMVVNYDLPPSKEEYIHRVGRTGRAGHRGKSITLWTDADLPYMRDILKVMRRSGSEVDPELERLVNDWHNRRAQMLLGKRNKTSEMNSKAVPNIVISRRRGERRLLQEVLHQQDNSDKPSENTGNVTGKTPSRLKWLRRWNPYRKPIHDLAGARATHRPNNINCAQDNRNEGYVNAK